MNKWDKGKIINLKLSAIVEKTRLKESIKIHSRYKPFNIYIKNNKGHVVADVKNNNMEIVNLNDYEKEDIHGEYLYKLIPNSKNSKILSNNWIEGFFIYYREIENTDLYVMIEIPIKLYRHSIFTEWTSQFVFLIFFIAFIYFILRLLNKWIFNDLAILFNNINNVNKLLEEDNIIWPNSNVVEISEFISNLKKMIINLKYSFIEIEKSKERLYELAYYDSLTKLPNRLYFKKALDTLVEDNKKVGVIFLDLNRFKVINDTLGHEIGDKLLIQVSSRLSEIRTKDINIFRLGGDEFVVVAEIKNEEGLIKIGEEIISKFKENFMLDNIKLQVSCSLGASIYPDHSTDISDIIKYADIAMYISKENGGKRIQLFNNEIKENVFQKLLIEKEILNALENNEFTLLYQPKYDRNTESIKSLEALIRWRNKELGIVAPDKFISIAEESDLILKIDRWVIVEACKQNKRLQEEGYKKVPISVNVSAKHFANNEIEKLVKYALHESGLEAKYLTIEITEGVLIRNFGVVEEIINNLNKIGVSVSIDDFGKGYSSFNQLMRLPIREIKIDKSFIRDISKDNKKENIVTSMVELAHRLEINVVAEGIETEEEKYCIKRIGCNELQGYYFTKPIEIQKIKDIIKGEKIYEK